MLAEFHGDTIPCGKGDDRGGVFEPWQLPVVGCVGECFREGKVRDDVSPVGELDEFWLGIVDCGLWDSDE